MARGAGGLEQGGAILYSAAMSEDTTLPVLLAQRGVWYLELRGEQDNWRLRKRMETPIARLEF